MARRTSSPRTGAARSAEHRIEAFAEDLGRLLGTARARAEGWLGQRETIAKHLADIRDTASGLLDQLTGRSSNGRRKGRGGRRAAAQTDAADTAATPRKRRRRRRKLSADARERIAEAQRRRWAKHRAAQK